MRRLFVFYPYGMPMVDVNSRSEQPYKFGGKEMDRTGGLDLYDFEARQYDSALPGFTSADPKAPDYSELSPYAYCAGNPLRYVDPTGMDWIFAKYENHHFFFYDENIESKEDVKNIIDKGTDIQYLGKDISVWIKKGGIENKRMHLYGNGDFSIDGIIQNQEYNDEKLHVGSVRFLDWTKGDTKKLYDKNYHGVYLGHRNPKLKGGGDSYAVPPVDYVDYAAFLHDKDYDRIGASGLGGVVSFSTMEADRQIIYNLIRFEPYVKLYGEGNGWREDAKYFFHLTLLARERLLRMYSKLQEIIR